MTPATSKRDAVLGRWLVVAATVFWGTTATLARFVFRDHQVPALTVVELRLSIAALVLFPYLLIRRRSALRIRRQDLQYFLLLGTLGVAAVQGSYYYSISKLGVGVAILIQYLAPSLIVLLDLLLNTDQAAPRMDHGLIPLVDEGDAFGPVFQATLAHRAGVADDLLVFQQLEQPGVIDFFYRKRGGRDGFHGGWHDGGRSR